MHYELLASIIQRNSRRTWARGSEEAGELWRVVIDTKKLTLDVQQRVQLPQFHASPIERFGGKGIAPWNGLLAVGTYDCVCFYEADLSRLVHQTSHPLMGDLHSVGVRNDLLYVTSPLANAILALDTKLDIAWTYFGHSDRELCRRLGIADALLTRCQEFGSRLTDYRFYTEKDLDLFHLNHHFFVGADLIVNLPPHGRLWNVTRSDWFLPGFDLGPGWDGAFHDGVYLPGRGHYVNHTQFGRVNKHHAETGVLLASIPAVPANRWPRNADIGWLRGLCHLEDELFLVGQGGPHLGLVDFSRGEVLEWWTMGDNIEHSFFAIERV